MGQAGKSASESQHFGAKVFRTCCSDDTATGPLASMPLNFTSIPSSCMRMAYCADAAAWSCLGQFEARVYTALITSKDWSHFGGCAAK